MIKDNTIYFGYGDILVGDIANKLILTQIQEPVTVGKYVDRSSDYTPVTTITIEYISYEDVGRNIIELEFALKDRCRRFSCYDYTFDFSIPNVTSMNVLLSALKRIADRMILLTAV